MNHLRIIMFGFLAMLPFKQLMACAVCFGDPNSPMSRGALAGVWFLLGVVVLVLSSIVGMIIFWARRARLLRIQAAIRGESTEF